MFNFYSVSFFCKAFRILLFLTFASFITISKDTLSNTIEVLDDGTTIIHTYNDIKKLIKEEIVLRNGRHKITYYNSYEQPLYGVLYSGTGTFGLMYYDQTEAPLFKFFDYGKDDRQLHFLSSDFEKIGTVFFHSENDKRSIRIQEPKSETEQKTIEKIHLFFLGLVIGIIFTVLFQKIRIFRLLCEIYKTVKLLIWKKQ